MIIKIDHEKNGRFYKQPFISEIDDANQTITFCGIGYHNQINMVERKIQTLTLGAITLLPHVIRDWAEVINTMLLHYELKVFAEQLNVLNVDDYGITLIEKFTVTTEDITLKNHPTWGFPGYVLYATL